MSSKTSKSKSKFFLCSEVDTEEENEMNLEDLLEKMQENFVDENEKSRSILSQWTEEYKKNIQRNPCVTLKKSFVFVTQDAVDKMIKPEKDYMRKLHSQALKKKWNACPEKEESATELSAAYAACIKEADTKLDIGPTLSKSWFRLLHKNKIFVMMEKHYDANLGSHGKNNIQLNEVIDEIAGLLIDNSWIDCEVSARWPYIKTMSNLSEIKYAIESKQLPTYLTM